MHSHGLLRQRRTAVLGVRAWEARGRALGAVQGPGAQVGAGGLERGVGQAVAGCRGQPVRAPQGQQPGQGQVEVAVLQVDPVARYGAWHTSTEIGAPYLAPTLWAQISPGAHSASSSQSPSPAAQGHEAEQ